MGLFTTRADLEAKLEAAETANAELVAENAKLGGELTNCRADLDAARKVIADSPDAGAVEDLTAKLEAAQAAAAPEKIEAKAIELVSAAEPPAPVQKVIASRVAETLAANGAAAPIENAEQKPGGEAKTITRAEFDAMDQRQRDAHMASGGKLKD